MIVYNICRTKAVAKENVHFIRKGIKIKFTDNIIDTVRPFHFLSSFNFQGFFFAHRLSLYYNIL